jgi:Putative transposase
MPLPGFFRRLVAQTHRDPIGMKVEAHAEIPPRWEQCEPAAVKRHHAKLRQRSCRPHDRLARSARWGDEPGARATEAHLCIFQGRCPEQIPPAASVARWRGIVTVSPKGVTFKYKDYRIEGPGRYKTMTLAADEFIRRFLMHVVPKGFHRIRHYGLLANGNRAANIAHARKLLAMPPK